MKRGIVVFGHGSRIESANEAVRRVAAELAASGGFEHVEAAFLELGEPGLETAVERLIGKGLRHILVVPYFLTLGIHLERDLPEIAERISQAHPGVEIRVTPPLDGHPALAQILLDRVRGDETSD